ncbi:hypothetical protein [Pseudomonas fluorescens]|uniref:Uncharacterized protein n=1 Tax=Pseudomonas fluorescens TaxID=294 RepID=A0A0F4TK57_PSEFL|nr:hypothetical protein [Pseudomonas fluorescens]KJZ44424.1 hypothetical protein VC34_12515 [Pseudomonas fluorescens]
MDYANPPLCPLSQRTSFITIISEHHGWRTLSGFQTSDYYAYRNAIRDGCHLQRASFDLRHPEEMVCDLSNLEPIYNGMYGDDIIRIWEYLNSSTRRMKGGGVRRIEGDGLSPEIAISGPSKSHLIKLKHLLVSEAFSHLRRDAVPATTKETIRGVTKNRLLINTSAETMEFHNRFCAFYSKYISYEHWNSSFALNTRYIYEDHAIWRQIEKISKNKLFLLSAGLPLALGYLAATGDQNIYFSEIHRQNDSSLLDRDIAFQEIFPIPNSSNDPWLIIDKAYTGGSLRQAANAIRKKFGYDIEVKTVALFPKSFSAFMSADYAVYAGKLFDVRAYAPRLDRDLWHMQLIMG